MYRLNRAILGGGFRSGKLVRALSPAAWYRLGSGITVATGVSAWADASGNSRTLAQATTTKQPALQADGSILFDGVDDFLATSVFTLGQPTTVYLRVKQIAWTSGRYLCDGAGVNTGGVFQNVSTPNLRLNAGSAAAENTNANIGSYMSVAVVFNGASSSLRIDSNAAVTGNAGAGSMGGFTLGQAGGVSVASNIQVKEVVLFAAAHTDTQQSTVISYLSAL